MNFDCVNDIHDGADDGKCIGCGVTVCLNCGYAASWWYSHLGYCKRCMGKNGHGYSFSVHLDVDRLFEYLGRDRVKFDEFVEKMKYCA